jgi:hypothetical protein
VFRPLAVVIAAAGDRAAGGKPISAAAVDMPSQHGVMLTGGINLCVAAPVGHLRCWLWALQVTQPPSAPPPWLIHPADVSCGFPVYLRQPRLGLQAQHPLRINLGA